MLTGKQKSFLRGLAMTEEPIVQVGKAGVNDSVLFSLNEALTARELVKVKVLRNCLEEMAEVAEQLTQSGQAELVQVIGRNILLYRPNCKKSNAIQLPKNEQEKGGKRRMVKGRIGKGSANRKSGV